MTNLQSILDDLQRQRESIDRAITALKEVSPDENAAQEEVTTPEVAKTGRKKRHLSAAGRKAIVEASRRRWANAKKAAAAGR